MLVALRFCHVKIQAKREREAALKSEDAQTIQKTADEAKIASTIIAPNNKEGITERSETDDTNGIEESVLCLTLEEGTRYLQGSGWHSGSAPVHATGVTDNEDNEFERTTKLIVGKEPEPVDAAHTASALGMNEAHSTVGARQTTEKTEKRKSKTKKSKKKPKTKTTSNADIEEDAPSTSEVSLSDTQVSSAHKSKEKKKKKSKKKHKKKSREDMDYEGYSSNSTHFGDDNTTYVTDGLASKAAIATTPASRGSVVTPTSKDFAVEQTVEGELFVVNVKPDGILGGSHLKDGMKLVSVNGIPCQGMTSALASPLINDMEDGIDLEVEERVVKGSTATHSFETTTVSVIKTTTDCGLTFTEGKDCGLLVDEIPSGSMFSSSLLRKGAELVSINGIPCAHMDVETAVSVLQSIDIGLYVTLVVKELAATSASEIVESKEDFLEADGFDC